MISKRPKPLAIAIVCAVVLTLAVALAACTSESAGAPSNSATDRPSNPAPSPTIQPTVPASPSSRSQQTEEPGVASEMPVDAPSASPIPPSDDLLAQGYVVFYSDANSIIYGLPHERGGYEHYLYRIGREEPYLAEGIYGGSTCLVSYINGILCLKTGSGNSGQRQYFDLTRGIKSEPTTIESNHAVYIDPAGEHYLIAYVDTYPNGNGKYGSSMLVIKDIFSDRVISIIWRNFNIGVVPLNILVFLNENEVYIDYDMDFIDGELVSHDKWVNQKETIQFR